MQTYLGFSKFVGFLKLALLRVHDVHHLWDIQAKGEPLRPRRGRLLEVVEVHAHVQVFVEIDCGRRDGV